MSHVMSKPAFCIDKIKGADQLHGNSAADQSRCFGYIDSAIPLLSKSEFQASSHLSSVAVQLGLCGTRSDAPKSVLS